MKTLTIRRGNFNDVAYSGDGRFLVSLNSVRHVRFWDLTDSSQRFAFLLPPALASRGALSLSGNRLALHHSLLDISAAWGYVRGEVATPPSLAYQVIDLEQKTDYTWLDTTPDGHTIAGASYQHWRPVGTEVRLWDARGRCLSQFHRGGAGGWAMALAPDARTMTYGEVKSLRLLNPTNGTEIAQLELTDTPRKVRFSSDGRLLAVAAGRTVWLWDVATHQARARFPAFRQYAEGLTFSADSRLLAAGSRDGEIRQWDTTTCRQVACYNWKVGAIHGLAFSPDGMTAAAAGHRSAIVLWDVE